MSIYDMTSLFAAGIAAGSAAGTAAASRSGILEMTQTAEDAVLRPADGGAWPHPFRAALAARIANLNGAPELAARYAGDAAGMAALADPASGDTEYNAVLAFMDKVAARTRDVSAQDISDLQASGVSDADIVRLAELNAFISYQVRVVHGLRLIREAQA